MEIIWASAFLEPLFLPPLKSVQTLTHYSMGFSFICLNSGSMFILTSQKDVFSGLLRQEWGARGIWSFLTFVFVQAGENEAFCKFDWST